jgi:hypothetical protein
LEFKTGCAVNPLVTFCDIHTYHSRFIPERVSPKTHFRYFSETPTFYQNYSAMRNIADVTVAHRRLIAVYLRYDIHGRKRCYFFTLSRTLRDIFRHIKVHQPITLYRFKSVLVMKTSPKLRLTIGPGEGPCSHPGVKLQAVHALTQI